MEWLFATHNGHKLREVQSFFPKSWLLRSLRDFGINHVPAESGDTLRENALIKWKAAAGAVSVPVFSEDTGLEVEALGGAPGVHTAVYAGENAPADAHYLKLLDALKLESNRTARFRTVICFSLPGGDCAYAEGFCEGRISTEVRGIEGFGYDPVFIPAGSELSFAEMDAELKNSFSHRRKAFEDFLKKLNEMQP